MSTGKSRLLLPYAQVNLCQAICCIDPLRTMADNSADKGYLAAVGYMSACCLPDRASLKKARW